MSGRVSRFARIVVDGNDGTGKSSLLQGLRAFGFQRLEDRGELTKATDDPQVGPAPDTTYLLLVCPWQESRRRLEASGADLDDPYHSHAALEKYDARFRALATKFHAHVIDTGARSPAETLHAALDVLGGVRVGLPKGRLAAGHLAALLPGLPEAACEAPGPRRLTWTWGPFELLRARTKVYPMMVAQGALDLAVCGSDVLDGSPWAPGLQVLGRVPQEGVRMLVAAPGGKLPERVPLRVASPFPELARAWFGGRGIPHTVFALSGTSEGFVPRFADCVLDIVETGETLRANGLEEVAALGTLDAVLVCRRMR